MPPPVPGPLRHRRSLSPPLALAVIACALLMRMLVPQGWMPMHTPQGWRIALCNGVASPQLAMPGHAMAAGTMAGMQQTRSAHHGGEQSPGDHPCAFGNLAVALDGPMVPPLDLPAGITTTVGLATTPPVAIGRGLAAPPPPATGPPIPA